MSGLNMLNVALELGPESVEYGGAEPGELVAAGLALSAG
jgi:hypothetical protein